MLLTQMTVKLEHTLIRRSTSLKTTAESPNPKSGLRMRLEKLTYDNLKIGAEVRDLSSDPPIMGFIVEIEAYGWSASLGHSFYCIGLGDDVYLGNF